jgi:hypothetical protein
VGFVVDKVALGQVFSEYFGFSYQFSFHQMVHSHLSTGAGTTGQLVTDVPSGLSLAPLNKFKGNSFGLFPSSGMLENTTFRKLDLFPSSGEGGGEDTYSVGAP